MGAFLLKRSGLSQKEQTLAGFPFQGAGKHSLMDNVCSIKTHSSSSEFSVNLKSYVVQEGKDCKKVACRTIPLEQKRNSLCDPYFPSSDELNMTAHFVAQ